MATFVYLEKTDETVTSCREVGKPALYPLAQRREECHSHRTWYSVKEECDRSLKFAPLNHPRGQSINHSFTNSYAFAFKHRVSWIFN